MRHIIILTPLSLLLFSCFGMASVMDTHQQIMQQGQKVRTSTALKNIEEVMEQKTYLEVDNFTTPQKDELASLFIYDNEKQKLAYCTFNPQETDSTATGFTNNTTLYDMEDNLLYEITFTVRNTTISIEYQNQAGENGSFIIQLAVNASNMTDIINIFTITNNFFNEPVALEMNSLTIVHPGSVTGTNEIIFYYNGQPAGAQVENIAQSLYNASAGKKIMIESGFFSSNKETALCFTSTIAVLNYISAVLMARQQAQRSTFDHHNNNLNRGPSWNNNGTIDNNNNPFDNF